MSMNASELAKKLSPAAKIVSPRSGIPIAQCLKIEAGRVVGSDWSSWLTVDAPELDLPTMCVNADMLMRALANAGDGDATIEASEGSVVVKCGRRRITIPTLPADEFPMPATIGEPIIQYRGKALANAIARSAPMASTNESLFHLCGVSLYGGCAVAADNASGCEVTVDGLDAPDDGSVILPRHVLPLISGEIDLSCDGRIAEIAMDGRSLVTRLVDGTFPDYRRVMPTDAQDVASFSATALLASAKAAVATIPENGGRLATLRSDGTSVALIGRGGTFEDGIGADVARDFAVGINVAKLAGILEALGDVEVQWSGDDVSKPQMLVAGTVRCVLMPVRIAL